MSRLAAKSPAAPFRTSRPAPVRPQRQTETQTLRRMVQEREVRIEKMRTQIRAALSYVGDNTEQIPPTVRGTLEELLRQSLRAGGEKS